MKILLVEDDPDDVLFMRKAFSRVSSGVSLDVAMDGEAAISALAQAPRTFSHLLLDLKLPKVSGIEVLTWLRSQPESDHLHVIVLTSSTEKSDLDRTLALGIDGYYVKPVSFDQLLDVTRQICDRWGIDSKPCPSPPRDEPASGTG
jgi:DNA-binding response OmpR family regulator